MESNLLALIPALPLLGAVVNGIVRPSRLVAGGIASAMVGLSALLSFKALFDVIGHSGHGEGDHGAFALTQKLWTWFATGNLTVDLGFRVDPLAAVMICVVTGIGFLIHVYSVGYMDDPADAKSTWRFFSYLNLFVFAMLLLVMGDSFPLMFVGWEGVGLCSYLLIGFWYTNTDYAAAGKKAFITNRVGDFSFLIGLFWLFWALGDKATMDFAALETVIRDNPALVGGAGGLAVTGICLLFFGGATGKSAQIPLYVWLPDAMAGPTPVSALIHAATMVTSGIYMLCRLNFLYVMAPAALAVVAIVGALTAFFAATIAVTQTDIKKVLAYSTVSQLGFMFLGVGIGAFTAGFFHVVTHAFFKALMFLGAGSIIHALHHEQDMRNMGGLRKYMPVTFGTFLMGYLAIIGFPFFSGFFSKDEILWLTFTTPLFDTLPMGHALPKVLWAIGTTTALLTAFYMSRLMFLTFWGTYRGGAHAHHEESDAKSANRADAAHDPVQGAGHGHADHKVSAHEHAAGHLAAHGAADHGAHGGHGDHGHGHAPHESPAVVTFPLIVLAILSVVGGALNLPAWLVEHGWMHHFLAPVFRAAETGPYAIAFHGDHTLEQVLMWGTVALIFGAVYLAWWLYALNPAKPAQIAIKVPALYNGSLHKWFVDEIYEATLIKPLVLGSRHVLWAVIDAQIIDGLVNGVASAATWAGRAHGKLLSGRVQVYAISIAAGTALIVTAYALGH